MTYIGGNGVRGKQLVLLVAGGMVGNPWLKAGEILFNLPPFGCRESRRMAIYNDNNNVVSCPSLAEGLDLSSCVSAP